MGEMEEKIGAVLNNPELMQQIMAMAQSMGSAENTPPPEPTEPPPPRSNPGLLPEGIDFGSIQRIAGLAQRSQIDNNQRALLRALRPYLSNDRIGKLEKAMRAAKIAAVAGIALTPGGIQFHSGR
jgi:hypothetical protein